MAKCLDDIWTYFGRAWNAEHKVLYKTRMFPCLSMVNEKGIAAKWQKDLSFGMTAFAGLAGAIVGIVQIAEGGDHLPLVWIVIGGALNFVSCLPISLSFKKGIVFGVK